MRSAVVAALLLGCSASEQVETRPIVVFGDDRVADALARDVTATPATFLEHEALFGVGRACASRATYVIEERATRFAERIVPRGSLSPRIVATGCSDAPETLSGAAAAFDLFSVLPTEPSRDEADPIARAPVEAMALDRTTGLYNFYVFDAEGVQRIVRLRNGSIVTNIARRDGSSESRAESSQRCYGCHVNGAPVMASLADPWTSWVSTHHDRTLAAYVGETSSLTSGKHVGLANALEGVTRNAIRTFVMGASSGQGLVARTLAGDEPGGLSRLLRSVFCETELQFASTTETMPLQLFVDPAAAAGAAIARPAATDTFPELLPIRAEIDLRIEEALISRGVLGAGTARAIRMLDDGNDIFSTKRCGLLPRVLEKLPVELTRVDAHIAALVRDALPADARYARALLDGREDGRDDYFAALRTRVAADLENRPLLAARLAARRAAARAMFPGDAHPLPFAVVSP